MRPRDLVSFSTLAGVPVRWRRGGTFGERELRPQFLADLEAAFAELWNLSGLGPAEEIVSGGAFVDRPLPPPPKRDRHAEGTAFDLFSVKWKGVRPVDVLRSHQDPRRYLGLEACLRTRFGQCLNPWYDADHKGHIHTDNRLPPGLYVGSAQCACFTQPALVHVFNKDLVINGRWDARSQMAYDQVVGELELAGGDGWPAFCRATTLVGFGRVEVG